MSVEATLDITEHKPTSMKTGYRVGIDIGGTKIEAVLIGPDGEIRETRRMPTPHGGEQVVHDVVAVTRDVAGDLLDSVDSVGIGIPGQVDASTGRIANVVNLDIQTLPLGALAERQLGLPVHVENDVNAAAVGSTRVLTAVNSKGTIVFLNFGTGLAAGIVIDGILQHGHSGAAGEIGHIPVDPNRFPCPCGQSGCLETVCSGSAVRRLWPSAEPQMPNLIESARNADPTAQHVLAMVTHAIVDAVQIIAQSFDPSMIIFGGGMAKTGKPLLDVTLAELHAREEHCPFLAGLNLSMRIRLAPPGIPIGALGAAWATP